MKTINIKIVKKSLMGVVEGLSVTIAQHNPEVDFQTIWASDAEEAKLDIYYREAITDLENFLAKFTSSTTKQFDLQALADDFSITIKTLAYWPPQLSGVLANQIQNYLVHAIMAGWLSDFPDMNHANYASMGANDLDAIKEILLKRDFNFAEVKRNADDATKGRLSGMDAEARKADNEEKLESSQETASRSTDDVGKDSSGRIVETRQSDNENKGITTPSSTGRADDNAEKDNTNVSASHRKDDENVKDNSSVEAHARNNDNASQQFYHEQVDWGGGKPPFELR